MAIDTIQDLEKALTFDIDSMIEEIMLMPKIQKEIIELNQLEQLAEGEDALGQKIKTISATEQGAGNVYGNRSIAERSSQGLQTDNVDLKITGTFWNTFKMIKVQNGWAVVPDYNVHGDDIRDNFESKFDFAGLTPDNLEFFVFNTLLPELNKKIKTRT